MKWLKNKIVMISLIIALILFLLFIPSISNVFKIAIIEYQTEIEFPKSTEIAEFQCGDMFFTKVMMKKEDYITLEQKVKNKDRLINTEKVTHPIRLYKYCDWWDIESESAETIYNYCGKSKEFNSLSVSKVWMFVMPENDGIITIYITVYG